MDKKINVKHKHMHGFSEFLRFFLEVTGYLEQDDLTGPEFCKMCGDKNSPRKWHDFS